MKQTASEIMTHNEFLVENLNGRSPAAVEQVRIFTFLYFF
jgi:hypothetical protein